MPGRILLEIYSYSILIASVIGAVRFKSILKSYRPFVYLMWVGLANEIISTIAISLVHDTTVNNNIYTLADFGLVVMLFMHWDEMENKRKFLWGVLVVGLLVWVTDNLVLHSLTTISSYFRIIYGVMIVFLSIEELNRVLFTEIRHSFKNAKLIICIGFIIAYTYQAVFEVFGVMNLNFSRHFYLGLYLILIYVNLFTNILFALAMLWVPTKRQFTLPYLSRHQ